MNQISGVVICYNEEKNIEACVLSLQKVCDEVIVLDSFSTDSTPEICLRLGVRFSQRKFDHYGSQKSAATALAIQPYILSLDADEELSNALIEEIRTLKLRNMAPAYLIPRLTNYCGEWVYYCGWYPDRKIRLWHSSSAQWTNVEIHETVQVKDKNVLVERLKNNILHYSYSSKEDHYERIERYTTIQANADFKKGKKSYFLKNYLSAVFKFIDVFFFKLGLMDGRTGLNICLGSAYYQYLKYLKLENLWKGNSIVKN